MCNIGLHINIYEGGGGVESVVVNKYDTAAAAFPFRIKDFVNGDDATGKVRGPRWG